MTRQEHLNYCSICTKRVYDKKKGILCSLTNEYANFEQKCPDYFYDTSIDPNIAQKFTRAQNNLNRSGFSSSNGIGGKGQIIIGIVLMLFGAGLIIFAMNINSPISLILIGLTNIIGGLIWCIKGSNRVSQN